MVSLYTGNPSAEGKAGVMMAGARLLRLSYCWHQRSRISSDMRQCTPLLAVVFPVIAVLSTVFLVLLETILWILVTD